MNHASFLGFAGIAGVLHPRARDDYGLCSVVAHALGHRPAVLRHRAFAMGWRPLIVLGLLPLLSSFARFAWDGLGTPAPIAPPTNLVVTGFYRRVRNPIYAALLIILLGEALLFGDERVAAWGVLFWLF